MIKIGLYGVENTHAAAFCKEFSENPAYADLKVTEVGGIYPESVEKLAKDYGAEIENDPERMAEQVDCAMITCRDGKYHLSAALPFLRKGLPVFLDKPLTVSEEDCETLIQETKAKNLPFIGGSAVKIAPAVEDLKEKTAGKTILSGSVTCPISLDNPYGGFFFYASHLTETMLELFGYEPVTVEAKRMPGGIFGTVNYPDFPVRFTYLEGVYDYAAQIDTKDGIFQAKIDLDDIFKKEAAAFYALVTEGKTEFTPYELTKSVYLNAAMHRALESGKPEPIGSLPEELR